MRRAAFALVLLLLAPTAHADEEVTAEHRDSPSSGSVTFGWFESRRYGQVFEASIGGRLHSVELEAFQSGDHATYHFQIFEVDAQGVPIEPPLYDGVFDASVSTGQGGFHDFRFLLDEPAHLEAGSRYAWVVGTADDNDIAHSGLRQGSGPYAHPAVARDGGEWRTSTSTAYYFTVWVTGTVAEEAASWGGVKADFLERR